MFFLRRRSETDGQCSNMQINENNSNETKLRIPSVSAIEGGELVFGRTSPLSLLWGLPIFTGKGGLRSSRLKKLAKVRRKCGKMHQGMQEMGFFPNILFEIFPYFLMDNTVNMEIFLQKSRIKSAESLQIPDFFYNFHIFAGNSKP